MKKPSVSLDGQRQRSQRKGTGALALEGAPGLSLPGLHTAEAGGGAPNESPLLLLTPRAA